MTDISSPALRQALAAAILPPGIYDNADPVSKARSNFAVELLMLIATPAPTSGGEDLCDWRPVLTEMVAAMNRYGHDIGDGDIPSAHRSLLWRAEQLLAKPASEPADGLHPDDLAVDRFAAAMKAKLAKKRAEGRGGWEDKDDCSNDFLSQLLREHVEKGDPVDVGNLAMMIHQRGERIS